MTNKDLKRAKDIEKSIETIQTLNRIVGMPYPQIISHFKDKNTVFASNYDVISFASFDQQTINELKQAMHQVIKRRKAELKEELNNL